MGGTLGRVGTLFSGKPSSGQDMPWTGVTPEQKAEDLRQWGYSEDQIRGLTSKAKPSLGQRFAQGTLRGLTSGAAAGLEEEARPRQQSRGYEPDFRSPPTPEPPPVSEPRAPAGLAPVRLPDSSERDRALAEAGDRALADVLNRPRWRKAFYGGLDRDFFK